MLKPIVVLVVVGAIGIVGYRIFVHDTKSKVSETSKLIHNAQNSVREADASLEKAKMSFTKVPLNEYKVLDQKNHHAR